MNGVQTCNNNKLQNLILVGGVRCVRGWGNATEEKKLFILSQQLILLSKQIEIPMARDMASEEYFQKLLIY